MDSWTPVVPWIDAMESVEDPTIHVMDSLNFFDPMGSMDSMKSADPWSHEESEESIDSDNFLESSLESWPCFSASWFAYEKIVEIQLINQLKAILNDFFSVFYWFFGTPASTKSDQSMKLKPKESKLLPYLLI